MPNPAFGGPENKLIEDQPNVYDVICRNASVLALHLWPTIFAEAPFRLRNIYRNGAPPRSRTTTLLTRSLVGCDVTQEVELHPRLVPCFTRNLKKNFVFTDAGQLPFLPSVTLAVFPGSFSLLFFCF